MYIENIVVGILYTLLLNFAEDKDDWLNNELHKTKFTKKDSFENISRHRIAKST